MPGNTGTPNPEAQLHLNGPEYGVGFPAAETTFSNRRPGKYGTDYKYDTQASMDFLAARGWRTVKLPIRWERIQPELYQALDAVELGRLTAFLGRCRKAGLRVNLDIHNYGSYYRDVDGVGVRTALGERELRVPAFVDLWRRLAAVFRDDPTVVIYNLCAEPQGDYGGLRGQTWRAASQAAVEAIREVDPATEIHVAGYGWSGLRNWSWFNPEPWITDPGRNFRYVGHHYWDATGGGTYGERTYVQGLPPTGTDAIPEAGIPLAWHTRILKELDDFVAWLDKAGAPGIIGELGWPHDSPDWNVFGDWYLRKAALRGLPVVHWCAGEWADADRLSLYGGNPLSEVRASGIIAEARRG
ncbi:glycoside hydrolase family 5 protein [Corynebacterium sp. YIM 101645]|uniref:Glycoside hydrolase family 5 protein n=1 Tax=Corynebacterium lemuris TaxID=1859292 RepID=A0ABT2G3B2_9CORY|nr:glycoside hydrolase family 5 protein [Corynebacterium lemuris]MCS5480772.1 glycoside hydrolase family 5 protein [Corynebacterium lemuris]